MASIPASNSAGAHAAFCPPFAVDMIQVTATTTQPIAMVIARYQGVKTALVPFRGVEPDASMSPTISPASFGVGHHHRQVELSYDQALFRGRVLCHAAAWMIEPA